MTLHCIRCGSSDISTGFRCLDCGTDNTEAVQKRCQHLWGPIMRPLQGYVTEAPPTPTKIEAYCLKCHKPY